MPLTLEELFSRGAQHTVATLLESGEIDQRSVVAALNRRFGSGSAERGTVVGELIDRTVQSQLAAARIPSLENPEPRSYPVNPEITSEFQYTVIGRLDDPLKPGSTISIPWTINSDVPLSFSSIIDQAEKDLNEGYVRPDNYNSAAYADLLRRDIRWQQIVKERFGNNAPVDVEVIGAFRRA